MSKEFTSKPGSFAKLDKDLYTSKVFGKLSIEAKYLCRYKSYTSQILNLVLYRYKFYTLVRIS